MRVIAGLLVAFLVLFLGVSSIVFLHDHLSDLAIWNSPLWKAWKVPLIICAVVFGIALLLYLNYLNTLKNQKAERELAQAQGWRYCIKGEDPEGLIPKILANLETACPGYTFSVTGSVMTVTVEKGRFHLFPCLYKARNSNMNRRTASACLIESERLRGMRTAVAIDPKTVLDSALTFNKVDMGDTEFARAYIVSSNDPAEAQMAVTESMKAMLVDYKNSPEFIGDFEISLGPGGALILNWSQALPDDWLALADVARRFASAMR
jgi:hypothetical protein